MGVIDKIKEFFKNLKEKLQDIGRPKLVEERVRKPLKDVTRREAVEGLVRDRAQKAGQLAECRDEKKKLKREAEVEEEVNLRKKAIQKRKQRIVEIINKGKHMEFGDRDITVISRDAKYIGKLISLVEYEGSNYIYVLLPDGSRTLYGEQGAGRRESIYYYNNFSSQINHSFLIINFFADDKRNLVPVPKVLM